MKNSIDIANDNPEKYQFLVGYDQLQIDNPNKEAPERVLYMHRLVRIIALVMKYYPPRQRRYRVADLACAQGNIGLMLAEYGYEAYLLDINELFIEYSRLKWEKGSVQWFVGNAEDFLFPRKLDVVIAGEIIEHCAYPEDVLRNASRNLVSNGMLLVTCPHGDIEDPGLPRFDDILDRQSRTTLKENQFGPTSEHHLFRFYEHNFPQIVPDDMQLVESSLVNGILLAAMRKV